LQVEIETEIEIGTRYRAFAFRRGVRIVASFSRNLAAERIGYNLPKTDITMQQFFIEVFYAGLAGVRCTGITGCIEALEICGT